MNKIIQYEISLIRLIQRNCFNSCILPFIKVGKLFTNKSRQNLWLLLLSLYDKEILIKGLYSFNDFS